MHHHTVTVEMSDTARSADAVALLAPLGIDTEFQRFAGFDAPPAWDVTISAEPRSGQRAAIMVPPGPNAPAITRQHFTSDGTALTDLAFLPEGTPLSIAASDMASDARAIAAGAGGGLAGIAAIVEDTSRRFEYGEVPYEERYYCNQDAVPAVACASGNCIDINTYLVAALRAGGYETAYLTCYYFDDAPGGIPSGMHCWVRTRHEGCVQDWDIAHFKKVGRTDIGPALNPVPGRRFALAYGRDHAYPWRGRQIHVPTPSRPVWLRADGTINWGADPVVTLS